MARSTQSSATASRKKTDNFVWGIKTGISFVFVFIAIGWVGCINSDSDISTLPFYSTPDFTPQWIKKGSKAYAKIHRIAPFSFTNQNGEQVTEKTFEGRIYVANFIFTTCPGICPRMTANLSKVQDAFKDDPQVLLLSHSVTPEFDSVEVLKKYADSKGVLSGKWHIITGDKKKIYEIARNSYFADEDLGEQVDEKAFLHTENFILIDPQRRIRGVYNGVMPAEIDRLIEDIRTLKKSPDLR